MSSPAREFHTCEVEYQVSVASPALAAALRELGLRGDGWRCQAWSSPTFEPDELCLDAPDSSLVGSLVLPDRDLSIAWLAEWIQATVEEHLARGADEEAGIVDDGPGIVDAEPFTMPGKGAGGGNLEVMSPEHIAVVANPRKRFDEAKLAELAESVREYGIIEPLVVNRVFREDGRCELVAGERRLRAAGLAGLPLVPCVVLEVSRKEAAELRLLENLQREDLTAVEEADAFAELIAEHGYTQEQLAGKLGKSAGWVSERLALRELPDVVREAVDRKELAMRTALALRPHLQPGPTEALLAVAKEMAERRPPAAEAADWVKRQLWQASRSLEAADEDQHLRYNAASEKNPPTDRVFPLDAEIEAVAAPPCTNCDRRYQGVEFGRKNIRCLQPSCWGAKQAKVWRKIVREHNAAKAEAERQKRERQAAQVERAVERETKAADTTTAPVALLRDGVMQLHDLTQQLQSAYPESKREALRARMRDAAEALGFADLTELEAGLAGGHGQVSPGSLPLAELAKRVTALLARKAAGEDITKPVVAEATNKRQAKIATAPPLPDADPALAAELRALADEHWQDKGPAEYERESFLPLVALLEHWQARREQLAASAMPHQIGDTMAVHIPEFAVWFNASTYQDSGQAVEVQEGQIHIRCTNGRTVQPLPEGMVYYRVRVSGTGAYKSLTQLVVMRCPGEPTRHLVVSGSGSVTIRRDLVPRWYALMNALPAVPEPAS